MVRDGVVRGVGEGEAEAEGAALAAGDDGAAPGEALQEASARADTAARRGMVLCGLSRKCWNGDIITRLPLRYRLETPVRLPAAARVRRIQRHPDSKETRED